MTFEQTRLDFIFFRLDRHLEVKSAQRKPPDIFLVRRLSFVAQDKYLFLDAPAHRHDREGQCIGFLFIDELLFMENIIVIARKMLVKFFRKKNCFSCLMLKVCMNTAEKPGISSPCPSCEQQ